MDEALRDLRRRALAGDEAALLGYRAALRRVTSAELAALLREDPSEAAWEAWADHLGDDPRAELVRTQLEPIDHHAAPALEPLCRAHDLLGPIETPRRQGLRWERGYWRRVSNTWRSQAPEWWEALFAHPSARFLRDLRVRWLEPPILAELLIRYQPPLWSLHWQEDTAPLDVSVASAATAGLRSLALWLRAWAPDWSWRQLEHLSLNACFGAGLEADVARAAEEGAFQRLRQLEIYTGFDNDLRELLAALLRGAPLLEELVLLGGDRVEEGFRVLVESGKLATLRRLRACAGVFDPALEEAWLRAIDGREQPFELLALEVYGLSDAARAAFAEKAEVARWLV